MVTKYGQDVRKLQTNLLLSIEGRPVWNLVHVKKERGKRDGGGEKVLLRYLAETPFLHSTLIQNVQYRQLQSLGVYERVYNTSVVHGMQRGTGALIWSWYTAGRRERRGKGTAVFMRHGCGQCDMH